ncbi:hypothetical protein EVAR_86079_1 [Eumeta japonica]|uniref:Uncharacterized protein n=1 Tax=Eumeta variegata TaxID=151549 RepID=A0A4C1UJI1_EUMVA|nr:hypothetical protein EVAR_86079_1 [Eumeta japonica]
MGDGDHLHSTGAHVRMTLQKYKKLANSMSDHAHCRFRSIIIKKCTTDEKIGIAEALATPSSYRRPAHEAHSVPVQMLYNASSNKSRSGLASTSRFARVDTNNEFLHLLCRLTALSNTILVPVSLFIPIPVDFDPGLDPVSNSDHIIPEQRILQTPKTHIFPILPMILDTYNLDLNYILVLSDPCYVP